MPLATDHRNRRIGLNIVGLIGFCLMLRFVTSKMNEKGQALINFFETISEVCRRMMSVVMV
jgi:Na+/H+-dicarboxylate symporter